MQRWLGVLAVLVGLAGPGCTAIVGLNNAQQGDGDGDGDVGDGDEDGDGDAGDGDGDTGDGDGDGDGDVIPSRPPVVLPPLDASAASLTVTPLLGLVADGADFARIELRVVDVEGTARAGVPVRWVSQSTGALLTDETVTNSLGIATGEVRADVPGTVTLTADINDMGAWLPINGTANVVFEDCISVERTYISRVMGPVMAKCIGCHNRFGRAAEYGVMQLDFAGDPDHIADNIATLSSMVFDVATNDGATLSYILAKPTNQTTDGHLGGEIIAPDSTEYATLAAFAQSVTEGRTCPDDGAPPADIFGGVDLADPLTTYRQAALDLTGHVPTDADMAGFDNSEAGLDAALDVLVHSEPFFERFSELINDEFLTDAYMRYSQGLNTLNEERWPDRMYFLPCDHPEADEYNCCMANCCDDDLANSADFCEGGRRFSQEAAARMPLDFYVYLLKEDLPATELLAADYTVVNRYTARVLGITDATFTGDELNGRWDLVPGHLAPTANNTVEVPFEHAGMLTNHIFMQRYPNTNTNVNRHRARHVYKKFLALDVMTFLNFDLDANEDLGEDPFQDARTCSACHAALDPVAGAFKNYDHYQQIYEERTWHDWLRPPGFAGQDTPSGELSRSLRWLGEQVTQDPRFSLSQVELMFKLLTGHARLNAPINPNDPDFVAQLNAFLAQDAYLEQVRQDFVAGGHIFADLIKDIIEGPYYRASSTTVTDPVQTTALALTGAGGGKALRAEQLHRKTRDLLGMWWARHNDGTNELFVPWRYLYLYGGIDSADVTVRFREPYPTQSNINRRMAAEMSCMFVPHEFSHQDPLDRKLLWRIERDTEPEDGAGQPIPANVSLIRDTLQDLHRLMLNEDLADDSPELDATYALFVDLWRDGKARVQAGDESQDLDWTCRVDGDDRNFDYTPQADFDVWDEANPTLPRIEMRRDDTYVVRAFMGVFTYLMSDYRFLFQ